MATTSTTGTTSTTSTSATSSSATTTSKTSLGKDDFLKLLTAQLANQDPLNPVDNQAFIAQLAQFSSLEQMQNVSTQLDTLLVAAASQTQLDTASLVGKTITYDASDLQVTQAGTSPAARVKLESAGSVTALIQDASGQTVRTLALGARDAGTFDLGWDGKDSNGNAVAAGSYTLTLGAKAADGSTVTATAQVSGVVSGVTLDGTTAELVVGGDLVKMSDVVKIAQP